MPSSPSARPRCPRSARSRIAPTITRPIDNWRTAVPLLALLVLLPAWGTDPPTWMVVVLDVFLAGAVLAAFLFLAFNP